MHIMQKKTYRHKTKEHSSNWEKFIGNLIISNIKNKKPKCTNNFSPAYQTKDFFEEKRGRIHRYKKQTWF